MQTFLVYLASVITLATLAAARLCGQQYVDPDLTIGARRPRRGAITPQIVGGGPAVKHSWPWFASLRRPLHFCGAAVISDEWVVTAAHCVTVKKTGKIKTNFTVVLADHNLTKTSNTQQEYSPAEVIKHPGFSRKTKDNDIALIRLPQKLKFNKFVQPICLPTVRSYKDGDDAWVIGFGYLRENERILARMLRQVKVPLQLPVTCRTSDYFDYRITDNMICTGYPTGMKAPCKGDSGGPLMVFNGTTSSWELAGTVSWAIGCARSNYPEVYARVTQYKAWLEGVMNGGSSSRSLEGGSSSQEDW